jgi:hypothetical protein
MAPGVRWVRGNKKRLTSVWEPSFPRGTEPYPDLAGLHIRGDGSGFNTSKTILWIMAEIIPEFPFHTLLDFTGSPASFSENPGEPFY